MKYALTIGERFNIMVLLPQEGDLMTMQDVADMRKELLPTAQERQDFGVVADAHGVTWNEDAADIEVEIDLTTPQVALVANALRKLADDKKLKLEHLPLYDKFVEDKNEAS